jgi:DNA-binding NarL/FixJ family response regulator
MAKVVIVEDQTVLREAYKALLGNADFQVVGEAGEGMAAIKCIVKSSPDLVLLDLSLPKMDGMAVLKEIKRHLGPPKVLVLTMNDSEDRITEAFENGADGFCLKDAAAREILSAMTELMKGRRYVSPSIADKVVRGYIHASSVTGGRAAPKLPGASSAV